MVMRQGAQGAIKGIFDGLATVDPAVRQQVRNAYIGDVDFQKGIHDLSQSLVLGAGEGLRQAQVDQMAAAAVNAVMTALRQQGGMALADLQTAEPELERALRSAITTSITSAGQALAQTATRDLTLALRALLTAAVDGTVDALSRHLHTVDLRAFAERDLAPAAGLVARTFTREAVIGLRQGLDEAGHGEKPPIRAIMREVGAGLAEGMKAGVTDNGRFESLLIGVLAVQGAFLLAVIVGGVVLWRRYQQTTSSLLVFARQMSEAEHIDQQFGQQLRSAIKEAHAASENGEFLRRFLNRNGLGEKPAPGPDKSASSK
jgi:hypothetical protein